MSPSSRGWARVLWRIVQGVAVLAVAALLAATGWLIWREKSWATPNLRSDDREVFFHGTIGTELLPLAAAVALPELYPQHFMPDGKPGGDWVRHFGFIPSTEKESRGLPVGFTITNYRPQSASPSPTPFVGFGCATCHTTLLRRRADDPGRMIVGPGNTSLNLFAWIDAYQKAILDDGLTADRIIEVYERKTAEKLPQQERWMIVLWLNDTQKQLKERLPMIDDPFGEGLSMSPAVVPTGPGRTQPFRTLVRNVLHRPGSNMRVYTKIATIFRQDLQKWFQFDGGIAELNPRSALAALAANATVENLAQPEITHNVVRATRFTETLASPKFADLFPQEWKAIARDAAAVKRGREMYRKHCADCHGQPGKSDAWVAGRRHEEVVLLAEIGTDPERVTFQHYTELPDRLYELFPADHPLKFPREDLRPGPLGDAKGYINKPLPGAFARAPYLHNASVPTLAALINLKPRPRVFYRGDNDYDPDDAGLKVADQPSARAYFKFNTDLPGNSNRGHDYPWPYRGPGWSEPDLKDLLAFLKTL
jgi:mono/diheme cytochrome c family protein